MTDDDVRYMKRALALARKGLYTTAPNPAVGCVIVKDGGIVGEGWHRRAGEPHAEVNALAEAGEAARGACVYVTLEPCCHTGKTPPCSQALIRAGVSRVVAGMTDPNPQVCGGGLKELAAAGIATESGILEEECRRINLPFIKRITTGRPYVTYKCAMTMDGRIASFTGSSRWISSEESRTMVHRLRSRCDAVMVGVDTVIADDPQLTVRHVRGRNPLRIVVDSRLRTPPSAALVSPPLAAGTIIATVVEDSARHDEFSRNGVRLLVCRQREGQVDLDDMLLKLGALGIQTILLEGGSRLAGDALKRGLIDKCIFVYAPKVQGSDGYSPFTLTGIADPAGAIRFRDTSYRQSGCDVVITTYPEKPCSQD